MRRFFVGVLTGLLLVVIAVGGFVLAIPQSAPLPPPTTSPSFPATAPMLSRGQTWLGDITLDSSALTTTTGGLRDVHASGTGVLLTAKGLSARTLTIDAVLPFAAAAASVGSQVQLYAATGGRAGLRRTVTVLGRDLQVTATGTVRAQDGLLVIEPDTIDLGGASWLDAATSASVRSLITIRQQVDGVPSGMRLTSVVVAQTGFKIHLQGSDVLLSTSG
jgi:hypothetical protein